VVLQRCRADGAGRKQDEGGRGAPTNGTDWSRRLVAAKLCEDRNLMKADGNSLPEFILGWTIGANKSSTTDGHGWTRIFQARRAGIFVDCGRKTNQAPFRSDIGGRPQGPEYAAPMGLGVCFGWDSTKMPRRRHYGRAGSPLPAARTQQKRRARSEAPYHPHSEFRRGNGSRRLGARSLAKTEIR